MATHYEPGQDAPAGTYLALPITMPTESAMTIGGQGDVMFSSRARPALNRNPYHEHEGGELPALPTGYGWSRRSD